MPKLTLSYLKQVSGMLKIETMILVLSLRILFLIRDGRSKIMSSLLLYVH